MESVPVYFVTAFAAVGLFLCSLIFALWFITSEGRSRWLDVHHGTHNAVCVGAFLFLCVLLTSGFYRVLFFVPDYSPGNASEERGDLAKFWDFLMLVFSRGSLAVIFAIMFAAVIHLAFAKTTELRGKLRDAVRQFEFVRQLRIIERASDQDMRQAMIAGIKANLVSLHKERLSTHEEQDQELVLSSLLARIEEDADPDEDGRNGHGEPSDIEDSDEEDWLQEDESEEEFHNPGGIDSMWGNRLSSWPWWWESDDWLDDDADVAGEEEEEEDDIDDNPPKRITV